MSITGDNYKYTTILDTQTGIFYTIEEASEVFNINKNTLYWYLANPKSNKTNLMRLPPLPTVQKIKENKVKEILPENEKRCTLCKIVKNKDCFSSFIKSKNILLQSSCKECTCERAREYYKNNREDCKKRSVEFNRKYRQKRLKEDTLYKLKSNLRSRIGSSFRRNRWKKLSLTQELVGCEIEFLKTYLESKFTEGMTWDNHYDYWEIDHIIPMAYGDTYEELCKLCHYTNLFPVTKVYNRTKKDNITEEDIERYLNSMNDYYEKINYNSGSIR